MLTKWCWQWLQEWKLTHTWSRRSWSRYIHRSAVESARIRIHWHLNLFLVDFLLHCRNKIDRQELESADVSTFLPNAKCLPFRCILRPPFLDNHVHCKIPLEWFQSDQLKSGNSMIYNISNIYVFTWIFSNDLFRIWRAGFSKVREDKGPAYGVASKGLRILDLSWSKRNE